jgi:hypothetical protein
MTEITRATALTILKVQAAGDGEPGTAAIVDIPTSRTMLLVELPIDGIQGIKLPDAHPGDEVDVFVMSYPSTGTYGGSKLRIWDADDNNIAGTDATNAMRQGEMISLTKILPAPYSESGFATLSVGTWIADVGNMRSNYPSS